MVHVVLRVVGGNGAPERAIASKKRSFNQSKTHGHQVLGQKSAFCAAQTGASGRERLGARGARRKRGR